MTISGSRSGGGRGCQPMGNTARIFQIGAGRRSAGQVLASKALDVIKALEVMRGTEPAHARWTTNRLPEMLHRSGFCQLSAMLASHPPFHAERVIGDSLDQLVLSTNDSIPRSRLYEVWRTYESELLIQMRVKTFCDNLFLFGNGCLPEELER